MKEKFKIVFIFFVLPNVAYSCAAKTQQPKESKFKGLSYTYGKEGHWEHNW